MAPCGAICTCLLLVCNILLMYSPLSVGRVTHSSYVTVFMNQPAVFPCITTSDSITWRVNGTNYSDLPPEIRSDLVSSQAMTAGVHLFTLTIPGRAEYNGTTVQCVTGHPVENENVTLRVQGRLASVGDLTADSSTSSFTTSWSVPFSLDVTNVDPDIWYTFLIYNVTDQENPTAIPCTDCHNFTQTNYTFSPEHPSPCHQYTFTVIPYNGAGQGESGQNVFRRLLASVGHLQTMYNMPSIIASWSAPLNCDIWYTVLIYNVTFKDNHTAIPCTDCHNLTQTHYIFSPDHPSPCHQYTFTVIPYNGAGQGESSQNVAGYTIDEKINIRCDRIDIEFKDGVLHVTFNVSGNDRRVCGYTLRDVDSDTSLDSGVLSSDKSVLSFIVDLNKKYELEVSNAAGLMNTPHTIFTSFDVQNITVQSMGTEVNITRVFISNSHALGCFVVLQCNENNPDHFRVLLRNLSQDIVSSIIDAPSKEDTEYTIFVYDLEEKGLPYERPAIARGDKVFVNAKDPIRSVSIFLKRAELSRDGSEVTIRCEFADEYPEASCVLIYREYNKTKLTVIEYDHSTVFPVSGNVPNSERYTFAVFGKNGVEKVEEEPVLTLRKERYMTYQSPGTYATDDGGGSNVTIPVIIAVGILILCILIVVLITSLVIRSKCSVLKERTSRRVIYDDIILPPSTSSVIPTEPNTAYASLQPNLTPPIPTDTNVAYSVLPPQPGNIYHRSGKLL